MSSQLTRDARKSFRRCADIKLVCIASPMSKSLNEVVRNMRRELLPWLPQWGSCGWKSGHTEERTFGQQTANSNNLTILLQHIRPDLQSRTKLLEKVYPIMSTFLCNKTISKTTPLWKENPFPQFNVASHKRPGIMLSFEYTTTLLSGERGEGRTGTATMFRKMLSKYTIFSKVLSKIVYKVIRVFSQE